MAHFLGSPPCHLSKKVCVESLFDVKMSSCANPSNMSRQNWSTWPQFFMSEQKKKSQAPLVGIHACLLGNILKFTAAKDSWACFLRWWFRNGGPWWRFTLTEKKLFLSSVVIQSLVWPASSVGEWIHKAYVKPGRRLKTWETSTWSVAAWFVKQSIVGNFKNTTVSFNEKQSLDRIL